MELLEYRYDHTLTTFLSLQANKHIIHVIMRLSNGSKYKLVMIRVNRFIILLPQTSFFM